MKFNIITPTYNRANTLELTIKYALKQSYLIFEMIINDDVYKCETGKVINKYLHNNIINYVKSKLLNFSYSYFWIYESIKSELPIKIVSEINYSKDLN